MRRIPTPDELRPTNDQRLREAAARRTRELAEASMDKIVARMERDGVPPDGLRYDVPDAVRLDSHATSEILRGLQVVGWHVILDPDDEDEIIHRRPNPRVLLIRFPNR